MKKWFFVFLMVLVAAMVVVVNADDKLVNVETLKVQKAYDSLSLTWEPVICIEDNALCQEYQVWVAHDPLITNKLVYTVYEPSFWHEDALADLWQYNYLVFAVCKHREAEGG